MTAIKQLFKWTVLSFAAIALLLVAISQFTDLEVFLVKNGVKLLDAPDAGQRGIIMSANASDSSDQSYVLDVVADGIELPWSLAFIDSNTALVTARAGKLYAVSLDTGAKTEVTGLPNVYYRGQGGLLDIALHPDFPATDLVYITYSKAIDKKTSTTVLARARYDRQNQQLSELQDIYTATPALPTRKHYGGRLLFHDRHLYLSVGERGRRDYAQKLDNDLGKVLRFALDSATPENNGAITPANDNPFIGRDIGHNNAKPAIYTYGHRNPQGMALQPGSDEIWVAEHGPQGGDEVNRLIAGANYGWPVITYGEEYGGGAIGEGTHKDGMQQPLHYYVPSIATGNLAFYRGDAFPNWNNSIMVTGLRSFDLSRLALQDNDGQLSVVSDQRLLDDVSFRLRDIKLSGDGLIYLLSENGSVIRLRPAEK